MSQTNYFYLAGVNLFNIDYNQFVIQNPYENDLADRNVSQSNLMIGSGAYLYNEKWAIGFAIPNMLKTKYINKRSILIK